MDWKINFSPEAKSRTKEIVTYFSREWSVRAAEKFTNILNSKIKNILLFPKSYPSISNKPNVRRCVITNQIALYYRISEFELEVITLFDTRQDPDKLNL